MLEAGGVGGVAGDGDVHLLVVHDGHALADVVGAVAADSSALAVGVGDLTDDVQLAGAVVELGLDVGEAVDAGDDLGGVLAQAVQDDAQGLGAGLVGVADDADGALGGGEGLVAGQEGEALGLVPQQHGGQVAVAQADLAVVGDGAGNAEGLQADADGLGGLGGGGAALLDGDGGAHDVGPAGVLKGDGLNLLHGLVGVDAGCIADALGLFDGLDAVLMQDGIDVVNPALITFKQCHFSRPSLLFLSGVNVLGGGSVLAVSTHGLFDSLGGGDALLQRVGDLAQIQELVADDLVVVVQGQLGDIALGHLQVAGALGLGAEHGAHLAAHTLAQVLQAGADGQAALGESGLAAAVDDLQEQLAHGHVDGVADKVGVQGLKDGLAGQDLGSHGGGVGHAGAAQGLDQGFFDDAVLDVEGELAGALLGCAPAHAVGETGNVLDLLGLDPFALFRDGGGAVVCALGHRTHVLYFGRIDHTKRPPYCLH